LAGRFLVGRSVDRYQLVDLLDCCLFFGCLVGWLVVWLVAGASVVKGRIISTGQCSLKTYVYKDNKRDVYINNHALFRK
jgi:hypothetical protein